MSVPPVEAVTLWLDTHDGGVPVAASAVGRAPLDLPVVQAEVIQRTGLRAVRGSNRTTLEYPVLPTTMSPEDGLRHVRGAYDQCARCHLCATRFQVVHFRGNPRAAVVFMGDGPSRDDNDLGQPFASRTGKLQEACNEMAGIDSERDVFWMNAVGCRAAKHWEEDRAPTEAELTACSERVYLMLQAIRPRVVVCLGAAATSYFFAEKPAVWSWTRFTPDGAPDDWIMVGYGHPPAHLARVLGVPSMYKEYAAQRTFYSILAEQKATFTKVSAWRFLPRYLSNEETLYAWHQS